MLESPNPFHRGFRKLRVERTLVVTSEIDDCLVYVRLHESQSNLPDKEVLFHPCVFNGYFALITDADRPPGRKLLRECPDRGHVRDVVFAILDERNGSDALVGYSPSHLHVAGVMKHLTFQTGHYSRSWEISTAHITREALDYISKLADLARPTDFLFDAFRVPGRPAIGLRLIVTPWTDKNLRRFKGVTSGQLLRDHLDMGLPGHLAGIVHLAGLADVRILIFDGDAPVLDGLPICEEQYSGKSNDD